MSAMFPTVAVIIAAAGNSTRMGAGIDKQFVSVGGRPLLWHSLQRISTAPGVKQMLVTVSPANEERVTALLRETVLNIPWQVVSGGAERQHSVRNAVLLTDEAAELVLVHDGARPFVEQETIGQAIEVAMKYGAAVVAVPVKDTIKTANAEAVVLKTLDRSSLWQIQTPQIFRRELLVSAHEQAAAAGLRSLFVGFETLNPEALLEQRKHQNLHRDYNAAVRRLHELGVMVNGSFVFGMDEDDESVFDRTVAWAVAQGIVAVAPDGGGVRRFAGGYDYYREKIAQEAGEATPVADQPLDAAKAARVEAMRDRKALKADLRRAEKEVAALEAEIAAFEKEQSTLHERLAAAETSLEDRAAAGRRLKEIEDALSAKLDAWETAGCRRDDLAGQV